MDAHNSVLIVLATGLGKTVIGAALIRRWLGQCGGRVLWLAHREELITQAADSIRRWGDCDVAEEMGDRYSDEYGFTRRRVVVASVQTLARRRRRLRFRPQQFGLIVTDEAHHAVARSYRQIYHYFRHGDEEAGVGGNPSIKHLGCTATPKRADNLAMGKVFDFVAYDYGIEPAVADGWLVPVRQAVVVVEDLDLSRVKVVAGDFQAGRLEAEVSRDKVLHQMAAPSIELIGDKQALFFCVGVHQSKCLADVLNGYRANSARFVSGDTDPEQRRQIVQAFREGRQQYLCNCGVFLEGFDAPATAFVVMARPTKSLSLYVQMLGRATRPLPGVVEGHPDVGTRRAAISASGKPSATVIDFVGNAYRHGEMATVSAADVLGGNYSDGVKQYAKLALADAEGSRPIEEALDRADAELALLAEEEERRARIVAEVDYRVRYLDGGMTGPAREQRQQQRGEPATDKQIWKLTSLGVPRYKAEKVTKQQARGWIGKLLAERGEAS